MDSSFETSTVTMWTSFRRQQGPKAPSLRVSWSSKAQTLISALLSVKRMARPSSLTLWPTFASTTTLARPTNHRRTRTPNVLLEPSWGAPAPFWNMLDWRSNGGHTQYAIGVSCVIPPTLTGTLHGTNATVKATSVGKGSHSDRSSTSCRLSLCEKHCLSSLSGLCRGSYSGTTCYLALAGAGTTSSPHSKTSRTPVHLRQSGLSASPPSSSLRVLLPSLSRRPRMRGNAP